MKKPVIKAIRVDNNVEKSILSYSSIHAVLLDTFIKGVKGGTGKAFNWEVCAQFGNEIPIILSGGLNASNVLKGIEIIKPVAIDINSGVESSPGNKDMSKIKELFQVLKPTIKKSQIFI